MKRKVICLGIVCLMMTPTVFATEFYTVEPPSAGIFGTPTSVTTVVADNVDKASIDKSI